MRTESVPDPVLIAARQGTQRGKGGADRLNAGKHGEGCKDEQHGISFLRTVVRNMDQQKALVGRDNNSSLVAFHQALPAGLGPFGSAGIT
jgi:hypothetical protein